MRHLTPVLVLLLCLGALAPALAAEPAAPTPSNAPKAADVREYIRLFGYRQMLETGAERQLASIIETVGQTREDVAPGILALIHQEMRAELGAALEQAVAEMVPVFQRHLSREDVAYLLTVGRDPRMQRVVALQPKISEDMEGVGERLAESVTVRAAPRIQERLRTLEGAEQL